jgi:hypothetical protein
VTEDVLHQVLLLGLEVWLHLELQPVREFPDELRVEQGCHLLLERPPERPGEPPRVVRLLQEQ